MSEVIPVHNLRDAVLDVVFLHGLDGDARRSWSREDPGSWWPTWLAEDVPGVAVWSVGYDAWSSGWRGRAMSMPDRAINLMALMQNYGIGDRPLCFVTHSMGGLLVKEMLLHAAEGHTDLASFATEVRGVVFLATPHTGSGLTKAVDALGVLYRGTPAVRDLKRNDAHLRQLNDRYRDWANTTTVRHLVFSETHRTKGVRVVDETSANPGLAGTRPIPIDANHIDICKPPTQAALVYGQVKRFIAGIVARLHEPSSDTTGDGPHPARPTSPSPFGAAAAGAVALEEAVRDLTPVLDDILDTGFTGRDWVIDQIDQLLGARDSGYVWIEAQAGMGKSALAAQLVRSRNWIGHFARLSQGDTVRVALQNLAGQLVTRYRLWDIAPGQMLPEHAFTPQGFERVLARAAQQALRDGEPVVMVVDGADEAATDDGSQPWSLPAELPPGVFVVGTYRTGYPPPPGPRPTPVIPILPHHPGNQRDLTDHVGTMVHGGPLREILRHAGRPADEFAEELTARCGGVWVYLRYIIREIEAGDRAPHDLASLPASLATYYTTTLHRWSQQPQWRDGLLPLLGTLAAAGEPLPTNRLAALSGVDERLVLDWCHHQLRPFLTTTRITRPASRPGSPQSWVFAIYHATFRELLTGGVPGETGNAPYWSDALGVATATAHHRIGSYYLDHFGGLNSDLCTLAANLATAEHDSGYPLRHLARHLVAAGRTHELHHLLRVERPASRRRAVNLWFAAHDHADSIDLYLADIALARQDCEHRTDTDVGRGRPAPSLAEEIRYGLITTSINSLTDRMPFKLVTALYRHGRWTLDRTLKHARRISNPQERARALTDLAIHLPDDARAAALMHAFDATILITDNSARADALSALARQLPADQLSFALDAATAIDNAAARVRALSALAQYLPTERQKEILRRALDAAVTITNGFHRADALAGLAELLPADSFAVAVGAATGITHPSARARALTSLVEFLPAKQRAAVVPQALDAAVAITNHDTACADALAALARYLTAEQQTIALEAATAIWSSSGRVRALAALARYLPDEQRSEVVRQAHDTAIGIDYESGRADVLGSLVEFLPDEQRAPLLRQALDGAVAITNYDKGRVDALLVLLPYLPPDLLSAPLDVAAATNNNDDRIRLLGALAEFLPAELLAAALDAAVSVDTYAIADALRVLAPYLPTSLLATALNAAIAVTESYYRVRSLDALAEFLPAGLVSVALDAGADVIDDACAYAETLGALADHVPGDQRIEVLHHALNIASNPNDACGCRVLTDLVGRLPAELLPIAVDAGIRVSDELQRARLLQALPKNLPTELLSTAIDAATGIRYPQQRARTLSALAKYLPAEQRTEVLHQALDAVQAIDIDEFRIDAICELLDLLPTELQAQVLRQNLDIAIAITHENSRAHALGALAGHLPPEMLPTAVDATIAISFEPDRCDALCALAPHLPPTLLPIAIDAVNAVDHNFARVRAIPELIEYVPAERQAEVARQTIADILRDNLSLCIDALGRLVEYLPANEQTEILRRTVVAAIASDNPYDRIAALHGVARYLPARERTVALRHALDLAIAETSESSRAHTLGRLARDLPTELLTIALDAAIAMTDEEALVEAIVAFAEYLPDELLVTALNAAIAITNDDGRFRTVNALAWHLPPELLAIIDASPEHLHRSTVPIVLRAAELSSSHSVDRYLTALRNSTRAISRRDYLRILQRSCRALRLAADEPTILEITRAIENVCHWWP